MSTTPPSGPEIEEEVLRRFRSDPLFRARVELLRRVYEDTWRPLDSYRHMTDGAKLVAALGTALLFVEDHADLLTPQSIADRGIDLPPSHQLIDFKLIPSRGDVRL